MRRRIVGFEQDEAGDWVALLDCHHRRHVRHRPPLWPAEWVTDESQRAAHVGTELPCGPCDRAELPDGLGVARTTPTWDEETMPDGLRRAHRVAAGVWVRLRVDAGALRLIVATDPARDVVVRPGETTAIPPDVEHHVEPLGTVRFALDFLRPAE